MKLSSCMSFLLASCLALTAGRSGAQTRTSFAFDATAGAGNGKGGEFFDRDIYGARLAASVRRSRSTNVGVFGELAIDFLSLSQGHYLVCFPNPRGGCKDSYPEFFGPTATLGVIAEPSDRLEVRLGIGGAAYRADGTGAGAVLGQLDVAVFPVAHVGLVGGARAVVVPRFRGDRLSMYPWAIGVRVR